MRGSRGGVGGVRPPLEFAKLNIADITGNEKNSYFSYVYVKQNQSCLRLDPPWKKFLDPRLVTMVKKSRGKVPTMCMCPRFLLMT